MQDRRPRRACERWPQIGQQQCRHADAAERREDERKDNLGRRPGENLAGADRAEDEGDRSPQADPAIVQAVPAHRQHGQALGEWQQRRPHQEEQQADRDDGPEPLGLREQGEAQHGEQGMHDHRPPPLAAPVGDVRRDRVAEHLGGDADGQHDADLGDAKSVGFQPHRPERHVHADNQEGRGVEDRQAHGRRRWRRGHGAASTPAARMAARKRRLLMGGQPVTRPNSLPLVPLKR
jgi:hypothetical protein